MKTYSAKPSEVEKKWLLIDAEGLTLGRLASLIAMRLRGKHKAMFTPHIDCGDNVIVINAGKVRVTGRKLLNDYFHWHTGYPGGLKSRSKGQILDGAHPERVLENAVRRMMPKDSPLARKQMTCLRLFAGATHDHEAQNPQVVDIGAMNPKNKRS